MKPVLVVLAIAIMVQTAPPTQADFWSDLRDALKKPELTKVPPKDSFRIRNLSTITVDCSVMDAWGKIQGWKRIPGGQEIRLDVPLGSLWIHITDQFGRLVTYETPRTFIPVHRQARADCQS